MKLVGPDLVSKRRVIMLSLANPLLLWTVLAGGHNDAIAVMFAIIALVLMRRHIFLAGLMIGAAGGTKLSIGLVGIAMLWSLRADRRAMLKLCVGGAIAMAGLYAVVGLEALQQAGRTVRSSPPVRRTRSCSASSPCSCRTVWSGPCSRSPPGPA